MASIYTSPVVILSLAFLPITQANELDSSLDGESNSSITVASTTQLVENELAHADEHHDKHEEGHHDAEHEHEEETENIIVQATRSRLLADDQPIRVEMINREEIEEKAAMRPGNISMLVAETGGVRMQTTSPALGSANIRLQGLYGRYTQLLTDGLPLYGNQAASIGLLQIPPTDVGRVEIIKGSASSLYGGSALGGVINLVSRKPGDSFKGEALLNLTTRNGQDLTTYVEAPLSDSLKGSFTGGIHQQKEQDVDDNGWIDLPSYERVTARPRVFWQGDDGDTLYATAGFMQEERVGGTLTGHTVSDGNPFVQAQDSARVDGGITYIKPIFDTLTLTAKASAMSQTHDHVYGADVEDDKHQSYFLESSVSGYSNKTDWVVGVAYQGEKYSNDVFSMFDYSYQVPGAFAQVDYQLTDDLTTSLSGRIDDHSEYGTQFSPRVSMLYQPGRLAVRGSYAQGYYAPTPFVEAIEDAGLSRLAPIESLEEEHAQTASLDLTYTFDNIETSLTLFSSDVENVTELEPFSTNNDGELNQVRLVNVQGESEIRGAEMRLRYYWHDIKLSASYLYLDATEQSPNGQGRRELALTPKHSAGFVAMWEQHGSFRTGFEAYYTGTQRINDNPYITESDPYWHLGLMGEITLGRISYFINLENLLNVKQTDEHPLLLPERAASGQWTTDIWSRNDGFIANAGIRVKF